MSRQSRLGRVALWTTLVLGLTIMWSRYGPATATTLLTVFSGAAALADGAITWLWRSRRIAASTPEQVDRAALALGREIQLQWETEANQRLLQGADLLPVRWSRLRGGGELEQLVRSFADAPGRLTVVGEAGSGKTSLCLLLVLELLNRPGASVVPVLLQVSSWDPDEHLHTWLINTVLDRYPFLNNEARYGTTAVRELLAQHRILPVLDGLDEMAADRRADALQALDQDTRSVEPFVLTCRTDEFEEANAAGIVSGDSVVRLLPVLPETAAVYLLDTARRHALHRWDPLVAGLTSTRDAALIEALSTPLMLFLARAAYEDASTQPGELVALADAGKIERRLLDVFTRRVFAARPPSPLVESARPAPRWDPARAERWLGFLARNCGQTIDWWRLESLVPRPVWLIRGAVLGGTSCTLLGWLVFGLFGRPGVGLLLGSLIGVLSGCGLTFVRAKAPQRFVPRLLQRRELSRDLAFGVVGALAGGTVVGVLWGAGFGVLIGLVFGLTFGVMRRFTEPVESREAVTPIGTLRADESAIGYASALGTLVGALVGAFMVLVVGTSGLGLIVHLRTPLVALLGAGVGAVVGGCGLGLVAEATSASSAYLVACAWLAVRGYAPFRLMLFLEYARRVSVLRQVGSSYQFRHAALQDRLAEQK